MRWFVTVPFCVLFTLISIHLLFYQGSIFDLSWVSSFLQDVYLNITLIQSGQWNDMIPSFRTLLFFVLLWAAGLSPALLGDLPEKNFVFLYDDSSVYYDS